MGKRNRVDLRDRGNKCASSLITLELSPGIEDYVCCELRYINCSLNLPEHKLLKGCSLGIIWFLVYLSFQESLSLLQMEVFK